MRPPVLTLAKQTFSQLIGLVLIGIGCTCVLLFGYFCYRLLLIHRVPGTQHFVLFAALTVLIIFCFEVGLRLLLNKPNRYNSLLPPIWWYVIGILLLCFGAIVSTIGGDLNLGGMLFLNVPLAILFL